MILSLVVCCLVLFGILAFGVDFCGDLLLVFISGVIWLLLGVYWW